MADDRDWRIDHTGIGVSDGAAWNTAPTTPYSGLMFSIPTASSSTSLFVFNAGSRLMPFMRQPFLGGGLNLFQTGAFSGTAIVRAFRSSSLAV